MTLTVSRGEGLTVITVASNPKSKWPVLCQILGFLCYSPVCSVSQGMKGKLKDVHTAFGIVQMIIGVLNIVVGIVFTSLGSWFIMYRIAHGPFWIGSVFLVVGIMCVLTAKFPTSCLLTIGIILNVISAGLAITAIVLYSVDLANDHTNENCESRSYYYSRYDGYGYDTTPSPEDSRRTEMCLYYKNINEIIFRGLDIMMIVLSVLQLCVTISFSVLTGKALCKKDEDVKSVEDPELHKPLLEDATAAAV
ncbi:transmembrane protein 176A-like [Onychostoma macrolepis]|uniref:transmembrane protein 176A-like n=1 Tax=Onychostoma macrolepis TaxID=369639 RepID=UPI00272A7DED|nr:transmembrane protein 176A-like [Onychostoma macrolepis]XP_058604152.1 transmembrane protein 176A-like [Onychostoma macrolepis]